MDIWDKCENVSTKSDLVMFVKSLRKDLKTNEEEWENIELDDFLDAIEAWMTDTNRLPENPNWKSSAEILLSGRFYE